MNKCYLCGTEISDKNRTVEHIVLNSIGGRLKSSKLICKDCNSTFGNTFDSMLSKQLEFFANFLDIKRERGIVQEVEMIRDSTGEKYKVTSKGIPIPSKPIVEEIITDTSTEIKIKARSKKELAGILAGLKKKHTNLNIDELIENANTIKEHISEPLHITLTIGGKESMPAILKMAINYYVEKTEDTESVRNAIDDLKKNSTDKVEPIILNKPLYLLDDGEITHSIFINGSCKEKKLYAIIELYSVIQFIVKLSDSYEGSDIQELYVYDVLKNTEISKNIENLPSFDFIFNFNYPSSKTDFSIMQTKMEYVMKIGTKRKNDFYISEAIEKAMNATWKKLPEGHLITKEDTNQLLDEIMKNIEPLLIR